MRSGSARSWGAQTDGVFARGQSAASDRQELCRLSRPIPRRGRRLLDGVFRPPYPLTEFVLREREICEAMMKTVPPELWIGPTLDGRFNYREPTQIGRIKKLGIQKPWAPARSYGLVARLKAREKRAKACIAVSMGASTASPRSARRAQVLAASKGSNCLVVPPSPRAARAEADHDATANERPGAAASDRKGQQGLRRTACHRRRGLRIACGRNSRLARRERRRKIDTVQGDCRRDHVDVGRLLINGSKVEFKSPQEALQGGVAMVYQESSLVPSMTVGPESQTRDGEVLHRSTARSISPRPSRCSR